VQDDPARLAIHRKRASVMSLWTMSQRHRSPRLRWMASRAGSSCTREKRIFYVIDRDTGRLISAEKLGTVTWAEKVDLATGRPVETPQARYRDKEVLLWPSFQAVHHWLRSPITVTGLVYVPTLEMPSLYSDSAVDLKHWKPVLNTPEYNGHHRGRSDVPRMQAQRVEGMGSEDPESGMAGPNPWDFERRHHGNRRKSRIQAWQTATCMPIPLTGVRTSGRSMRVFPLPVCR